MRFDAVFFDVGNTLIRPEPSVAAVCAEILHDAGHDRTLAEIDPLLPAVDAYYEDRYRADDSFWASDDGAADVWLGMYTLLCRRLRIPEAEARVLAGRATRSEVPGAGVRSLTWCRRSSVSLPRA